MTAIDDLRTAVARIDAWIGASPARSFLTMLAAFGLAYVGVGVATGDAVDPGVALVAAGTFSVLLVREYRRGTFEG